MSQGRLLNENSSEHLGISIPLATELSYFYGIDYTAISSVYSIIAKDIFFTFYFILNKGIIRTDLLR